MLIELTSLNIIIIIVFFCFVVIASTFIVSASSGKSPLGKGRTLKKEDNGKSRQTEIGLDVMNCNSKSCLKVRMNISKKFVLMSQPKQLYHDHIDHKVTIGKENKKSIIAPSFKEENDVLQFILEHLLNNQYIQFGAFVVIHDTKERIILHRKDGFLGLPGGKIERNETPLAAAIRETEEEIGLKLNPKNLTLVAVHEFQPRKLSIIYACKTDKSFLRGAMVLEPQKHFGILFEMIGERNHMINYHLDPETYEKHL